MAGLGGLDDSAQAGSASIAHSETLRRLASKPGVIAALVVDRTSRAVLQQMGTLPAGNNPEAGSGGPATGYAELVCGYVESTGRLAAFLDSEDDVKLLRIRTKKHELVIVPDAKFIFVVIHDVQS